MTQKQTHDLKTFIENINKKDKLKGNKIHFNWVKRKRPGK